MIKKEGAAGSLFFYHFLRQTFIEFLGKFFTVKIAPDEDQFYHAVAIFWIPVTT